MSFHLMSSFLFLALCSSSSVLDVKLMLSSISEPLNERESLVMRRMGLAPLTYFVTLTPEKPTVRVGCTSWEKSQLQLPPRLTARRSWKPSLERPSFADSPPSFPSLIYAFNPPAMTGLLNWFRLSHLSFPPPWRKDSEQLDDILHAPLLLIQLAHQRQREERSHVLEVGTDLHVHLVPARLARHVLDGDLRRAQGAPAADRGAGIVHVHHVLRDPLVELAR